MKKIIKRAIYIVLSILVPGVVSFFIWASFDYKAHEITLDRALKNDSLTIVNTDGYISIKPLNFARDRAYIFYPGAKVQPEAYIAKLSMLALSDTIQIIIPKMFKNLAFFGIDKATSIKAAFPAIKHWYIGGHSLGGSMACMLIEKNSQKFDGVLLFGTYSGTDLSKCSVKFLSINGTEDGIFLPEEIESHKFELPKGAQIKYLQGMNHADIGNYGAQSGDKPSKLNEQEVITQLKGSIKGFFD